MKYHVSMRNCRHLRDIKPEGGKPNAADPNLRSPHFGTKTYAGDSHGEYSRSTTGVLREHSGTYPGRSRSRPGTTPGVPQTYSGASPGVRLGYSGSSPGSTPGTSRIRPRVLPEDSRSAPGVLAMAVACIRFCTKMWRSQIRIRGVRFPPFGFDIAEMTAISHGNMVFQGRTRR